MTASIGSAEYVDLPTGKVLFPLSLVDLPGHEGLGIDVHAVYNGAEATAAATRSNEEVPTGVLGLGWSIPRTLVRRETGGTGIVAAHEFTLVIDGKAYRLRQVEPPAPGAEDWFFVPENGPFWQIIYSPRHERWLVRMDNGTDLRFGERTSHPDGQLASEGDSIEWDVVWDGWTGPSGRHGDAGSQAVAWNLVEVVGPQGQKLSFSYEQERAFFGGQRVPYRTRSCRLAAIGADRGPRVRFIYGEKERFELPPSAPDPAVFPDRLERHFLQAIDVLHDETALYRIRFDYQFLDKHGRAPKRLLTRVQKVRRADGIELEIEGPIRIDYYGLREEDGVSGRSPDEGYRQGAWFAAIRSLTHSAGERITFVYDRKPIAGTDRAALGMAHPSAGSWREPRVLFGPDFVTALWQGETQHETLVQIYEWSGQWRLTLERVIPFVVAANLADSAALQLGYVALVGTDASGSVQLALQTRWAGAIGSWKTQTVTLSSGAVAPTRVSLAGAARFCAVLVTRKEGQDWVGTVHRCLLDDDAGTWAAMPVTQLDRHPRAVFAMGGRNNYLFTVTARGDDSRQPRLSLGYLDRLGIWQNGEEREELPFIPYERETGGLMSSSSERVTDRLSVQAQGAYVLVQARAQQTKRIGTSTNDESLYRHFVFHLTDGYRLAPARSFDDIKLGKPNTVLGGLVGDTDVIIEATDERFALVNTTPLPHNGVKFVYRFDGRDWHRSTLPMERPAAFWGGDVTVATQAAEFKKTTTLQQFDPRTGQWSAVHSFDVPDVALIQLLLLSLHTSVFMGSFVPGAGWIAQLLLLAADAVLGYFEGYVHRMDRPGPQGDRYVLAGDNVLRRRSDWTWEHLGQLPRRPDEQLVYNQILSSESHFLYMVNGPAGPRNVVAVVENGGFFTIDLPTFTPLATEPGVHQPVLTAGRTVIAYPRTELPGHNEFKNASSFSLFWLHQGALSGEVTDVVLSRLTFHDGFQETGTCFDYDATDAWVEPLSTRVFYGQVRVARGTGSFEASAAAGGYEAYRFHNGRGAGKAQAALVGQPFRIFAGGGGVPVRHRAVEIDWESQPRVAINHPRPARTAGYVARQAQLREWTDGTLQVTTFFYAINRNGLLIRSAPLRVSVEITDRDNHKIVRTSQTTYADQAWGRRNLAGVPVQVDTIIQSDGREVGRTSAATTWKFEGEVCRPVRDWIWQGWGNTAVLDVRRLSVGATRGWWGGPVAVAFVGSQVRETEDETGVRTSRLFDRYGRVVLAEARGASFERGEAMFFAFEPYEDLSCWRVEGSPAGPLPIEPGECFAGSRSLRADPGAVLVCDAPPAAAVPTRGRSSVVVAAYVNPRAGFFTGGGDAALQLVVRRLGGAASSLPFSASVPIAGIPEDRWSLVERTIDLQRVRAALGAPPDEPVALSLRIVNARPRPCLVDCVRVAPIDAAFSARVLDSATLVPVATLGTNNEVGRAHYRDGRVLLTTVDAGGVVRLTAMGGAWREGADPSPGHPNFAVRVVGDEVERIPALENMAAFSFDGAFGLRFSFVVPLPVWGQPEEPVVLKLDLDGVELRILGGLSGVGFTGELRGGQRWKLPDLHADDFNREGEAVLDCLVVVIGQALTVVAGGRLWFSDLVAGVGGSRVRLSVESPPSVRARVVELCAFAHPEIGVDFVDGAGKLRQSQVIEDERSVIVIETVYDEGGRPAMVTQPARKGAGAGHRVLGFEEAFVRDRAPRPGAPLWDPDDGRLEGAIRDWLDPDVTSERPYRRTHFERAPTARPVRWVPVATDPAGRRGTMRIDYQNVADSAVVRAAAAAGLPDPRRVLVRTSRTASGNGGGDDVVDVHFTDPTSDWEWSGTVTGSGEPTGVQMSRRSLVQRGEGPADALYLLEQTLPAHRGVRRVRAFLDRRRRLIETHDSDTGVRRFVYDQRGRPRFLLAQPPAGNGAPDPVQYFVYDGLGRTMEAGILSIAWDTARLQQLADGPPPQGGVWLRRFTYDGQGETTLGCRGRLVHSEARPLSDERDLASVGAPVSTTYEYDALGRLIRETVEGDALAGRRLTNEYSYDRRGRLIGIRDPLGRFTSYTFDRLGRVRAIGATPNGDDAFAAYSYNAWGALRTERLGSPERPITVRTYTYRPQGQLLQLDDSAFFTDVLTYIGDGRIRNRHTTYTGLGVPPFSKQQHYLYDPYGRLQNIVSGLRVEGYDDAGNALVLARPSLPRQVLGYGVDSTRLMAVNGEPVTYDHLGRVRSMPGLARVEYDAMADKPSSLTPAGGLVREQTYDATGRRVVRREGEVRTIDVRGPSGGIIARLVSGPSISGETSYVRGPFGLIAAVGPSGVSYVSRDHLGSTVVVSGPGRTTAFDYDVLGKPEVLAPSGLNVKEAVEAMPFLFAGREYDPDTGCYDFGARLFAPTVGRFLAPDPLAQYANPYVYAGNDPINFVDPTGMNAITPFKLLVGGVRTLIYAVGGTVLGAASGAIKGAGWDDAAGGARSGALWGLASGAGLGLLVMLGTLVRGPFTAWMRRGEQLPIILYDETFVAEFGLFRFKGGRLVAEMIAESRGIPRRRWQEFLISHERLAEGNVGVPDRFSGEVFVQAHGSSEGEILYRQAAGWLGWREPAEYAQTVYNGFRQPEQITQVTLGSCYAGATVNGGPSFASNFRTAFNLFPNGGNLQQVEGGRGVMTFFGEFRRQGQLREFSTASMTLHYIFPFF